MAKNKKHGKKKEPLQSANDLGYLSFQVVERGLPHCEELKEGIEKFIDDQIAEYGGFRQEYACLHVARVNLEKALWGVKVAHNKAAKQQAKKGVRKWKPEDWDGFGGGR